LEEGCEIVGLSKQGIRFGARCTVGRHAIIRPTNVLLAEPGEGLILGDHSNIGAFSYVGCSGYIAIGAKVLMGPRVQLLAENHRFDRLDTPIRDQGVERSFIRIEDDCWIGAGSTILAGVTVRGGSVVAAGAVVTRDVPAGVVVAGVPAKVVRERGAQDGPPAPVPS
jgi:acetyltransferase-like isoleucine patch superfamily enzyme